MKLTLKNLSMAIMMSTIVMGSSAMAADSNEKIVIAHRGASGYLPEHTLPAKAMAYAQGADYLEQDLVMTKDDHLVVLHDHYLDRVTDVADRFPDRARKDGRYYAIDFTLDEIKSLKFTEGFDIENGKKVQTYPGRFPMGKSDFRVHTFEEEIEFVQGLNHSTGEKYRYLSRNQSAVVPSSGREGYCGKNAGSAEEIWLHPVKTIKFICNVLMLMS
ncbi:glycerophosphodiester phosphodiesterase [Escherichia coli]|uniref:glycerophosphodiester phosphodiesterase n=1 Tax=Escherichia coli TaxID=562 RepID=A0A376NSP8_ECOLX|nr:glycerophosphodiester phosphodiesterase [Escherichia coli]